jgi:hypothetical protein
MKGRRLDGLFDAIDVALDRLEPLDRHVLVLRLGARGVPPLTLGEMAQRYSLGTRQAAYGRVAYALKRLRRIAGPGFERVLRDLEALVSGERNLSKAY